MPKRFPHPRAGVAVLALLLASAACSKDGTPSAPPSGSLTVQVAGLPAGVDASILVTGAGGFSRSVTGTTTMGGLATGTYSLAAANVTGAGGGWAAALSSATVSVTANGTSSASVTYALITGALIVPIATPPAGVTPNVTVTGPAGYTRTLSSTDTLRMLAPGAYNVAAAPVTSGGATYTATPTPQSATVAASLTPSAVNVITYDATTGQLTVSVNGLPDGAIATISVAGPGGFAQAVLATETMSGLTPGGYVITAANSVHNGQAYEPTPTVQNATVTAGGSAIATVNYQVSTATIFNLTVPNIYITQGSQTFSGSVPLAAGRQGVARVFVHGNIENTAAPVVRLRFYQNNHLAHTVMIPAPSVSTPQSIVEGDLASTWNATIPGSVIQPGVRVLADVDPSNQIAEANEQDNSWPASGQAFQLDVMPAPPFRVRLVPVTQSITNLTGSIPDAQIFLDRSNRLWPFPSYDAEIRSPLTTSAAALESGNANGAWSVVLSEVRALRIAESSDRNYYGVVKVGYASGVAGIGYVGYPTAIGWDHPGSAGEVAAHEFGHNFGRRHAPCGTAGSTDANYPYAGGLIGVLGLDVFSNILQDVNKADVMGYCGNTWVSDYNYTAVLNFRSTLSTSAYGSSLRPTLLLWGRLRGSELVLEPAFEIDAAPALPARPGPYTLTGLSADGAVLFTLPFEGEVLSHEPSEKGFAFALPLTATVRQRLATIRLRGPGGETTISSRLALAGAGRATMPAEPVVALRGVPGGTQVTWSPEYPMALVRDARTGEILAFARSGSIRMPIARRELVVTLSDGVRSVTRRVQ